MNRTLENAALLIKKARKILVLTGAGISTESGIPDFRSKTGLYNKSPEAMLSHNYFFNKPERFYEFVFKNMYYPNAKPNQGHNIISKWQKEGQILRIITQNIDGLHQAAGAEDVIEFHGNIRECICRQCNKIYSPNDLIKRREEIAETLEAGKRNLFYICASCEGDPNRRLVKPNVVLYGERGYWLTDNPFYEIQCMAYDSDLILVLGTTMVVTPFGEIPKTRNRDGNTQMVIINKGETPYDKQPWVHVINAGIGETLTDIDNAIHAQ